MSKDPYQTGKKCGNISLIGRPNSGKSTLLNSLIGEKIAIVSERPQTTRNRIVGVLTKGLSQLIFVDNPGIHRPGFLLNQRMMQFVYQSLREVDVIVHVMDVSKPFGKGELFTLETISSMTQPKILALNKIDLIKKSRLLPMIERYERKSIYKSIIPISAEKRENLPGLLKSLIHLLPQKNWLYPDSHMTNQTEHQLTSEIIREKVLQHTYKELPYSTAVEIEVFDESRRLEGFLHIAANIIVEKPGQKKILIGRGGKMIKKIGSEARRSLLKSLRISKMYLELNVKIVSGWRNRERLLDTFGVR